MAGITFNPSEQSNIEQKQFDYPFQELYERLSEYLFLPDDSIVEKIKYEIKDWTDSFFYKLDIKRSPETDNFILNIIEDRQPTGLSLKIKPANLYTACLTFGKYIPIWFVAEDQKEVTFADGSKIEHNVENDEYSLLLPGSDINICNIMYISEEQQVHERFDTFLNEQKQKELDAKDSRQKFFDSIKDNLQSVSVKELYQYLSKVDEKGHRIIGEEIDRRHQLVRDEFELANPGVPYGSILLEVGKNYSADMDGNMEIRTVNGQLWTFPPSCGSIDEILS